MTYHLLLLFSAIVNISLSIVAVAAIRRVEKLGKKLKHTETCLRQSEENNRKMLDAMDIAKHSSRIRR